MTFKPNHPPKASPPKTNMLEIRASTDEFWRDPKHSAHNTPWVNFLKHLFIHVLKMEFLPSQGNPLYHPLGLSSTIFWNLSICVSVYKFTSVLLLNKCPSVSFICGCGLPYQEFQSVQQSKKKGGGLRERRGNKKESLVSFLLPTGLCPLAAASIMDKAETMELSYLQEEKGPHKWLFHWFLVLRPLRDHDVKILTVQRAGNKPAPGQSQSQSIWKIFETFSSPPSFPHNQFPMAKAKRFFTNCFHPLCFFKYFF